MIEKKYSKNPKAEQEKIDVKVKNETMANQRETFRQTNKMRSTNFHIFAMKSQAVEAGR